MSQDIANATTQNNLHDRLERLCKNLDPQSIEVVSRIINRLKLTTLSKDKSYTGVSKEEHKALENLRDNYLTNIIKLDENLYFLMDISYKKIHFTKLQYGYMNII